MCTTRWVAVLVMLKMSFTTGDGVKITLNLPDSIYLDEPASGDCIVSSTTKPHHIMITPEYQHSKYCKVNTTGSMIYGTKNYRRNFTVTCNNSSAPSVKILCFIPGKSMPGKKEVQGKLNTSNYITITCVYILH